MRIRDTVAFLAAPQDTLFWTPLRKLLRPLEDRGKIRCWTSLDLQGGDLIAAEVKGVLRRAHVVVVGVSPEGLQVLGIESLLARAHSGEFRLVPLYLRPSLVENVDFSLPDGGSGSGPRRLIDYSGLNTPARPLSAFTGPAREAEEARIAGEIVRVAASAAFDPWQEKSNGWCRIVAHMLDQPYPGPPSFLDRSSRRPAQVLARLHSLFPLAQLLSLREQAVLQAAAHSWALVATASSGPALPPDLLEPVATLTAAATARHFGNDEYRQLRLGLLAALLVLGDALFMERGSRGPEGAPPRDTDDWLVCFTAAIKVQPGGVITYVLEVPNARFIDPVRQAIVLGLEPLLQEIRQVLGQNGMPILRNTSQMTIADSSPFLPPDLLPELRRRATQARQAALRGIIEHLGDEAGVSLAALLPLPEVAVGETVSFPRVPTRACTLVLTGDDDHEHIVDVPAGQSDEIIALATAALHPGVAYRWAVYCDFGAGEPELVCTGAIRTLDAGDQLALRRARSRGAFAEQLPTLVALGLWNEILAESWPRLSQADAAPEEVLLAYDLLLAAFRWMRLRVPSSTQVDVYNHAVGWLAQRLVPVKAD